MLKSMKYCVYVVLFLILYNIYSFDCAKGEPINLTDLSKYEIKRDRINSSEIDFIKVEDSTNLSLDGPVRCATVSKNNEIAILSSGSNIEKYKNVITIFDRNGKLQCIYSYYVYNKRFNDLIFFDDNNRLFYFVRNIVSGISGKNNLINLSKYGHEILHYYVIPDLDYLYACGIDARISQPCIINKSSTIVVSIIDSACVISHDTITDTTTVIYDHRKSYSKKNTEQAQIQIVFAIASIIFIIVIGIICTPSDI